jgi:hypothetical protein
MDGMQRSTTFLVALFVVAISASAAIKFQCFAKVPIELGRSVRADATQTGRNGQVGPGGSTGVSLSAAQRKPNNPGSANEASPTSAGDAGARPFSGNAMHQSDLEIRATSDASTIVRFKAAQGLSDFPSSSAVRTLSNVLLTDQAPMVRLAAVQSLVDIAKDNPGLASEVRAALQAVANDSNNNVSVASRQAISEIQ